MKGAWSWSSGPFLKIWGPITSLERHFKFGVQTHTDGYKCIDYSPTPSRDVFRVTWPFNCGEITEKILKTVEGRYSYIGRGIICSYWMERTAVTLNVTWYNMKPSQLTRRGNLALWCVHSWITEHTFNCLIETEGLFKVKHSHTHTVKVVTSWKRCKTDVATTNHYYEAMHDVSNSGNFDDVERPSTSRI